MLPPVILHPHLLPHFLELLELQAQPLPLVLALLGGTRQFDSLASQSSVRPTLKSVLFFWSLQWVLHAIIILSLECPRRKALLEAQTYSAFLLSSNVLQTTEKELSCVSVLGGQNRLQLINASNPLCWGFGSS